MIHVLLLVAALAFAPQGATTSTAPQDAAPNPGAQAESPSASRQSKTPKEWVKKLRTSEDVARTKLIKKVDAIYPEGARNKHIKGPVVFIIVIDKQGNVVNAKPVSGKPELVEAGVAAVKQWKYKPTTINGELVEVETRATVKFKKK